MNGDQGLIATRKWLEDNMDLLQKRLELYDELLRAARGDIAVDLAIKGGRILNVMTGEILKGDLAIHRGFIVSLFTKNIQAKQTIDARGKIAVPAFIDPHVHIESSMVLPPAYAEIAALNGTGTILADPHEIVNVMGVEGWSLMADNAGDLPVRLFFDIPTCVPSKRGAETSGADIQAAEVREMARRGGRKLGELMSDDEIVAGEPVMSGIVKTGWELGLPRDAHFPMISVLGSLFSSLNPLQLAGVMVGLLGSQLLHWPGLNALPLAIFTRQLRGQEFKDLNAYLVALGLTADHETYGPEIQAKLDHGMRLMISSHVFLTLPQMMPLLLQGVRRLRYKDPIGLCTDDMWPDDLIALGGMAGVLRLLVKNGIAPVDAVRFATLNNAQRLAQAGMREAALIGALAPGMSADLALVAEPLRDFKIDLVIHEGAVVAEHGKLTGTVPAPKVPAAALASVHVAPVSEETFRIAAPAGLKAGTARMRLLSLPKPPALPFPDMVEAEVPVVDGQVDALGYILIAAFNRYGDGKRPPVMGLIKNYTLKQGAVASTLAHDSHNLIVLGTSRADMALAANTVLEMNGGMAAVLNGQVLATLPFPVGGLMTTGSVAAVAPQAAAFRKAIGSLGLDPKSPILPFAVFSLPVGPGAKVTDQGLWDANKKTLVPLFV
jgi:adenine deaminase